MSYLSVIIPVRDEEGNVLPLLRQLHQALDPLPFDWEVIFVDDGSQDLTFRLLQDESRTDFHLRVVRLTRSFGQAAAIQAGFDAAEGQIFVTMDGDCQNDPADIPKMLAQLTEDIDVVLGERVNRQDKFWLRKVPSWCANRLIRSVLKIPFRDFGCTLRVFRREFVNGFSLYGEMHRFLTALLLQQGARAIQIPVRHHPRRSGTTKYTLSRTVRVMLDLITVKFMANFHTRPMHWFGGIGLICMALGFLSLAMTVMMKWNSGLWMTGNPLLMLSVMFELMGVQFLSIGLLGEALSRSHYDKLRDRPYRIRSASYVVSQSSHERERSAA